MSYLSNPSISLDLRKAAADAALAYVEALAHEESMFRLLNATKASDPCFDGIIESHNDAVNNIPVAEHVLLRTARAIAKTPPM